MRDVLFGGLTGMALAIVGFPFYTWQYWLLFLLALAWRFTTHERIVINSGEIPS